MTEQATLPTQGLAGGQLSVKSGILYAYDSTRSKWLSVQRMFMRFGRSGKTKNQYLNSIAGPSNNSGDRLAKNATIVSIAGQLDAVGTCDFRVRKNDDMVTNLVTLNLTTQLGDQDTTININLNQGDYLQAYLDATGQPISDPNMTIEVAWRE